MDVIEALPSRWASEEARHLYESMEVQRMEIIRTFTIPPDVLGVITPERIFQTQLAMHRATERLVAEMADLLARYAAPQIKVSRSCKCSGILHSPDCPEAPAA